MNLSAIAKQFTQLIEYDLQSGYPFDAFDKFGALQQETCTQHYELCDSIAEKLIGQISETK